MDAEHILALVNGPAGRALARAIAAAAALWCAWGATPAPAALIWWDGSRDEAAEPPGKLLSDNEGYWGAGILTGVEYTYETAPDSPPDVWRDDPHRFGRRLLDGRAAGNWWVPVGVSAGPLVVVFDFRRPCRLTEVDLCTRSRRVAVRIEARLDADAAWEAVRARDRASCPDAVFHRLPLPAGPAARFLRLTVEAQDTTRLDEVVVWGDAEVSAALPEAYRPIVPPPLATEIAFASIPGIDKTAFSDAEYWDWQRAIGDRVRQPAVWSQVPTWDSITHRPLLPAPEQILGEVGLVMARNETEHAALALTSTTWEAPRELVVTLSECERAAGEPEAATRAADAATGSDAGRNGSPDRRAWRPPQASVRVAGAIGSRHYGVNLGPLFAADNMLAPGLMQRYLTNGAGIAPFPRLTLSPAGAAVLWLTVTTADAAPGRYVARLVAADPAGAGRAALDVRIEVLDVTLPQPFVWLQTWSGVTSMFPCAHADRDEREVEYKQSLGVTVWHGWPTENSPSGLARSRGRTIHQIWGIGDYGHRLYNGRIDPAALTADDAARIAGMVGDHVAQARALGLDYADWYVELTDEPGAGNAAAFGALAALVRRADPRVRIYCNPSFWVGNGVLADADVFAALSPWYGQMVDVSAPIYLLLRERPQSLALFAAPRFVRACYTVSTQSAKSERAPQVELYRRQAWDAFQRGWNGWGFYSYYAPRGNPWSDFDADWYTGEDRPDYLMVYPGPRGPVPTRQSEAVRQGWEDYCLLTLLRARGAAAELQAILAAYEAGESLDALRLRALRAAGSAR